ncbi:TetR family transcriptional regulator [Rhizobium rhizosphaerae]|uniref:TetR family transcriptional regulator n=1 Tax=Xaviernesmea rhizosphaerae TaxID=1672749 RepID=A0A1Q9APQ4_9HYPH|nr:TetR/AcrR family transcriptional regulator [Xaviernesmea rhizosphaerae]OLP57413.1 TetR family transcriptional regulator [Xaviernesmea rhizosphaerae]OQP84818.1 TetR family transcriptional regulator [Xaviernesmea rhizosphaerae]
MNEAKNTAKAESATRDDACGGRRVAGADPAKREQILAGAKTVFMRLGFDAASMNDITREAGVSKGTIYVYFDNKEDLFCRLIEEERTRFVRNVKDTLNDSAPIADMLTGFGIRFATHVCSESTICAMRSVLSVQARMPHLTKRFFSATPENVYTVLKAFLDRHVAAERLEIEDTDLAARQFIDLCTAGVFKRRLFNDLPAAPDAAEIARMVASAVRLFILGYAPASGVRPKEPALAEL